MGSFNSKCIISNIPITRKDECRLWLITENSSHSLNNLYYQYYTPTFFPIKGKYDDYGSIESIERDWNIELMENFFSLSIEEILDSRSTPELCFDVKGYSSHDDILHFMKKPIKDSYRLREREDLESLGFIFINEHDFIHPVLDQAILRTNKSYSTETVYSFSLIDKQIRYSYSIKPIDSQYPTIESVQDKTITDYSLLNRIFGKIYAGNPNSFLRDTVFLGLTAEQTKKYKILKRLQTTFISEEVWQFIQKKEKPHKKSYALTSLEETLNLYQTKSEHFGFQDLASRLNLEYNSFSTCYFPYIVSGETQKNTFIEEFLNSTKITSALYKTNTMVVPATSYSQYGGYSDMLEYQKKFVSILKEKDRNWG